MPKPLLPALAVLSSIACPVRAADEADAAVYNAILASVKPGQTTVEMGDMIVPVTRVQAWRDRALGLRAATQTSADPWPGGVVYYAFNANVSAEKRAHFVDACEEWAMFANLTFTPRTTEPNYIRVNEDPSLDGGNSAVGMTGGLQQLNVGANAWSRFILAHEIGHSLGLIHEHQRSDRDHYVSIVTANISFGQSAQFTRIPSSTHFRPYDFLSIMHYERTSFTDTPGLETITCKPGYEQYQEVMGRFPANRWLSRGDRESIATMYGPGPALSTVVTNTRDSGPGSLRAALYHAFDLVTDTPGATPVITFQIPLTDPGYSGGVFTIQPSGRLPGPPSGVTVDATTQTAFTGDTNPAGPEVVLNGARSTSGEYTHGFILAENGAVVRGFVINGFSDMGLVLTGTNNRVEGCYIGTDAAGTAAVPNTTSGVDLREGAAGNTIGGATAAERNVISGNNRQGVAVTDATANVIRGNYIGTDATGAAALANNWSGIAVFLAAAHNTLGPGNVISGNTTQGILLADAGTTGNQVTGNVIGLNAAGTAALGNGQTGVQIQQSAAGNTVGGAGAEDGNVISGNAAQGVLISGAGTAGNVVRGNKIGTSAPGAAAFGNATIGVSVQGGAADNTVGPDNIISGNGTHGTLLTGPGTAGNIVTGNFIGTDAAGAAALANTWSGVAITGGAAHNTVGPGNVISGNLIRGVVLTGAGTAGNVVRGNYIGTDAPGAAAVANSQAGVAVTGAASGNIIGPGNVISGNANEGVLVSDAGTSGNVVRGNTIGLNAARTAALPNAWTGVQVNLAARDTLIGGASAAERNLISGNLRQGITISGAGTTGNVVRGNYIGTDAAGVMPLANAWAGVAVNTGAAHNTIGPGNVLSGNANQGVVLNGTGVSGNTVTGNFIGTNASGTAALPNALTGVSVLGGATGNAVGPGNVISGNLNQGVLITAAGTNGNTVKGNFIGLNAAGTGAVPNAWIGVQVNAGAQANSIGGFTAAERNVVSGNTLQGVVFNGAGTSGNFLRGNFIGTSAAGLTAVPNVSTGVDVFGGAAGNVVGGVETGAGNVISGNNSRGVSISGAGTNATVCAGNIIGLNAAGTAALANAGAGVLVFGGALDTVIGATAGGRNFIAGNTNSGVRISGAGTNGTRVVGNSIGVSPAGELFANAGDGVECYAGSQDSVVGGSAPGSANLIRGNTRDGIGVVDAATVVAIAGNSISGNGGEGIDLAGNGVTANDTGDGDSGPNGLQNFPVLTSAVLDAAGTTVAGTLNTAANTVVRVDCYANASGNEGQFYLGSQTGITDGGGHLTINTLLAARIPAGYTITATATGPGHNTSEFSAPRTVTTTDSDGDGLPDAWELANSLDTGSNDAAFDSDGDGESNLAEFRAGTDPQNGAGFLQIGPLTLSPGDAAISFTPVAGLTYRVEYSATLTPGSWLILADQLHAGSAPLLLTDPGAGNVSRRFYRLSVVP